MSMGKVHVWITNAGLMRSYARLDVHVDGLDVKCRDVFCGCTHRTLINIDSGPIHYTVCAENSVRMCVSVKHMAV